MDDPLIINGAALMPGASASTSVAEVGSVDEMLELQAVTAESMGWWPLGGDAYLHAADRSGGAAVVISVVGMPQDAQEGMLTLLLV